MWTKKGYNMGFDTLPTDELIFFRGVGWGKYTNHQITSGSLQDCLVPLLHELDFDLVTNASDKAPRNSTGMRQTHANTMLTWFYVQTRNIIYTVLCLKEKYDYNDPRIHGFSGKKHYWNNNDDDYRHYKYEYEWQTTYFYWCYDIMNYCHSYVMLIIKIFGSSKVSPLPSAFTPQAAVCFTELLEQEDFSSRNLARAILTRCPV